MDKQNLEKNFISAVIYLNTAENAQKLSDFIARLVSILSDNFLKYEIICVDDGSPQKYVDAVKRVTSESVSPRPGDHSTYELLSGDGTGHECGTGSGYRGLCAGV